MVARNRVWGRRRTGHGHTRREALGGGRLRALGVSRGQELEEYTVERPHRGAPALGDGGVLGQQLLRRDSHRDELVKALGVLTRLKHLDLGVERRKIGAFDCRTAVFLLLGPA